MTESRIQFELVLWFSQNYPQYRGSLFELYNNPANIKHAMKRRSMGMISGISDLIFIVPKYGKVAAIEIKAPGSRHSAQHIRNQTNWGRYIIDQGLFYLICPDLEEIKEFIINLTEGSFIVAKKIQNDNLHNALIQLKNKTVLF